MASAAGDREGDNPHNYQQTQTNGYGKRFLLPDNAARSRLPLARLFAASSCFFILSSLIKWSLLGGR